MRIKAVAEEAHRIAQEHGFWEPEYVRPFDGHLALIHAEVSEALEEWRRGYPLTFVYYDAKTQKPEGIPIELADIIMRVLDLTEGHNIDIEEAIRLKMEYNNTRPYRHGDKQS